MNMTPLSGSHKIVVVGGGGVCHDFGAVGKAAAAFVLLFCKDIAEKCADTDKQKNCF